MFDWKTSIEKSGKTYIIAEMSANHAGSITRAKEIIRAAKEAGADCVKIQTYTPDTLTIDCDNSFFQIQEGTWKGENLYSLYGKAYTPWEWHKELFQEAKNIGIDFFSTPFDKTSVDFLEECGAKFYKIASFELVDLPLIRYIASKGKPIIMSTGMGTLEEIKEAVETIENEGNNKIALLKCQSAYPATPSDMHLVTISDMKKRFPYPIGLSDHSLGSLGATTAVAIGASIIEKHFCISRDIKNPDALFSMTKEEFANMVMDIRKREKKESKFNAEEIAAMGKISYGVSKEEEANVVFRRSLFVVKDIEKGEKLSEENIRSIRPAYGMKPKYFEDVLGLIANEPIKRGTPLGFCHIKKMGILYLTNNKRWNPLFTWAYEQGEMMIPFQNELTIDIIKALEPKVVVNYSQTLKPEVLAYINKNAMYFKFTFLPDTKDEWKDILAEIENKIKNNKSGE